MGLQTVGGFLKYGSWAKGVGLTFKAFWTSKQVGLLCKNSVMFWPVCALNLHFTFALPSSIVFINYGDNPFLALEHGLTMVDG